MNDRSRNPHLLALAAVTAALATAPALRAGDLPPAQAATTGFETTYFLPGKGSTVSVTSASGNVVFRYRFMPDKLQHHCPNCLEWMVKLKVYVNLQVVFEEGGTWFKANSPEAGATRDVSVPVSKLIPSLSPPSNLKIFWHLKVTGFSGPSSSMSFTTDPQDFILHTVSADLRLSIDPDAATAWPRTFEVKNTGDAKSAPTFLDVKSTLQDAGNPVVQSHCKAAFADFTKEILPLGPGESKSFSTVDLHGSAGLGLLKKLGSKTPSTPPQSGTPAPTPPAVQQVVACRYQVDAKLGSDTNTLDPTPQNNKISRQVKIDVPMN